MCRSELTDVIFITSLAQIKIEIKLWLFLFQHHKKIIYYSYVIFLQENQLQE